MTTPTLVKFRTLMTVALIATCSIAAAHDDDAARYRALPKTLVERAVDVRDLDLGSQRDVKKLYGRLYRAARVVCAAQKSYPREYIKEVVRPCVRGALDQAVLQAGSPALTAYHEIKAPKALVSSLDHAAAIR